MSIPFKQSPQTTTYVTQGKLKVTRTRIHVDTDQALQGILDGIDHQQGALFSSGYEFPGRYSRWDVGFLNPPLELRSVSSRFELKALNSRGELLLDFIFSHLNRMKSVMLDRGNTLITGSIKSLSKPEFVLEENRTKQPSMFQLIRHIKQMFESTMDPRLGLYGAFGYDLVFQLEPIHLKHKRSLSRPDMVLYIPDEILIVDRKLDCAYKLQYDFEWEGASTESLPRVVQPVHPTLSSSKTSCLPAYLPGQYASIVTQAIEAFRSGDLVEVVPSHTFHETCEESPSAVFSRLSAINPSPYGFILHLGHEHLVGASPEMYVRVGGRRVETCPISGTIKRGDSPLEDADQVRKLLNSPKDEAELTMCTDVDRNDKSRICEPGTIQVIGRRQLEMYSHLIHTVDHIEGTLDEPFDALDAFMTHMWAVTVTGAPKRAAIQWIENHEDSPRGWYGGAVGFYTFDGHLNTGLTLRTMKIADGRAEVRVGATLLYDSDPMEEEQETLTKGAALFQAIRGSVKTGERSATMEKEQPGTGKRVLVIDHEDSFVHTLASYFRQTGAQVMTVRWNYAHKLLEQHQEQFDCIILSPGPGRPANFRMARTLDMCVARKVPILGVCLGLQGLVEYYGGTLQVLNVPQHGKSSVVNLTQPSLLWRGIPDHFQVGRYHSLYAADVPDCLKVTAISEDGIVMAVEHKQAPLYAVQFHPESILSLKGEAGYRIIRNFLSVNPSISQNAQ